MPKALIAVTIAWFFGATAFAQEAPPATEPSAEAPTECAALPPPPDIPDGAHANGAAMNSASDAFAAWHRQAVDIANCRIRQSNAIVDQMNSVSHAWNAQIDAYCGRRNVRCEQIDRGASAATPAPH